MDREELRLQLMATFKAQLDEHVNSLNTGLLALEKGPTNEEKDKLLAELFRAAHCVKGAARSVDLRDIEAIAHRIEDVFGALKRGELSPAPELIDVLLPAVDALSEAMDTHMRGESLSLTERNRILSALSAQVSRASSVRQDREKQKTAARKSAPKAPQPIAKAAVIQAENIQTDHSGGTEKERDEKAENESMVEVPSQTPSKPVWPQAFSGDTIRVKTEKLDALMDGMGELLVARMRTEQRLADLNKLEAIFNVWEKGWRQVRSPYRQMERQRYQDAELKPLMEFIALSERHLRTLSTEINQLAACFDGDYRHMALLTDEMQDSVRKIRMVPVSSLFETLPRMVRDLGRQKGKAVTLTVEGADTEIDRQVLEAMKDPLIHLLRNALDHGIEPPERRENIGKPRQGTIHLRAFQRGNVIVLEVGDDGAGIDLMAVKRAAVASGLLSASDAESLSEQETVDLIFQSGLSTLDKATDLSGRGVGMDVVRKNLEQLNGMIEVQTKAGSGTIFSLTLPLTLATSHVLLLKVGGQTVAVPTTTVVRILKIRPDEMGHIEGKPAISVNNQTMPLISTAQVLEWTREEKSQNADPKIPIIILGLVEKRMAFRVDGFLNTQEVVIKNLGRQLNRVRNVTGATILGTGQVVMILNVAAMIKSAQAKPAVMTTKTVEMKQAVRKKVLVVDDSITTRTLEKNILENAGYQVLVASDGLAGWELIQSEPFDAAVLDVDMPRMNGFELTERVKKDARLEAIPVILVTSLESSQDKIKGMEAGADAYITKGAFDQEELLETIERLIG